MLALQKKMSVINASSLSGHWPSACLVLFTRYPCPGTTKTRLIPALGPEGAARLQKVMTERIVRECAKCLEPGGVGLIISFSGASTARMRTWLGAYRYLVQTEGDIGIKMSQAFIGSVQQRAKRVLLLGSDIPELSSEIIGMGLTELSRGNAVFGPSADGGFYAIGMTATQIHHGVPSIFENVEWSTASTGGTVLERMAKLGCSPVLLPVLQDIDLPEDLTLAQKLGILPDRKEY